MIGSIRAAFNTAFTETQYEAYVKDLDSVRPGSIDFRVAETPVFIDKIFKVKMLSACESIVDVITGINFKQITRNAIPRQWEVPNENGHSHFIAFDFGICHNTAGELEPQLIEMQGFPSLFCYEAWQAEVAAKHFSIPQGYSNYLGGFTKDSYLQLLEEIIVDNINKENVVLLELFPHQQKTRIDFYCTEKFIGIQTVCLTEIIQEGRELYYLKDGIKTRIRRIYNRLIFDELMQQEESVKQKGQIFFEDLDVEWVPHPNWFFRISKYTLPFLHHPYIPESHFVKDLLHQIPEQLEHYVLKPLFSFAGQGVVIDVTKADIENIPDPENWILQKKVNYADVIATPDGPAKAEIRIFYFWKDGWKRPVPANNLARLSKGKMIGVRYNQNKTWVGGTIAFFEE